MAAERLRVRGSLSAAAITPGPERSPSKDVWSASAATGQQAAAYSKPTTRAAGHARCLELVIQPAANHERQQRHDRPRQHDDIACCGESDGGKLRDMRQQMLARERHPH